MLESSKTNMRVGWPHLWKRVQNEASKLWKTHLRSAIILLQCSGTSWQYRQQRDRWLPNGLSEKHRHSSICVWKRWSHLLITLWIEDAKLRVSRKTRQDLICSIKLNWCIFLAVLFGNLWIKSTWKNAKTVLIDVNNFLLAKNSTAYSVRCSHQNKMTKYVELTHRPTPANVI